MCVFPKGNDTISMMTSFISIKPYWFITLITYKTCNFFTVITYKIINVTIFHSSLNIIHVKFNLMTKSSEHG